jgi:hypothetical protein|tara:strand:- start:687 stop:884 length:198 start_codon:yes stop_codon:yes gene_type:complete
MSALSFINFISVIILVAVSIYLFTQVNQLHNNNDDNKNILLNLQNMINHNFWTVSKHVPGIKEMN